MSDGEILKRLWEQRMEGSCNLTELVLWRDVVKLIQEAKQAFPKLEGGMFAFYPDGSIHDVWATEVLDWVTKYLGEVDWVKVVLTVNKNERP